MPRQGHASLEVYNVLGQRVATLYEGEAGVGQRHRARFDASGLYFY